MSQNGIDCSTCGGSGYVLDGDHPDGDGCADCMGTGRIDFGDFEAQP